MKKFVVLCLCMFVLCSCGMDTSTNQIDSLQITPTPIPTATPKPIPQAFLGSTLKDFKAHFAGKYDFNQGGDDTIYLMDETNIFSLDTPNYTLSISSGRVVSIGTQTYARNYGAACTAFLPKDAKRTSNFITDTPQSPGAVTSNEGGAEATYTSDWEKKQFHVSSGIISLSWVFVDDSDSMCSIGVDGK